jgi:hypothetical protein
MVQHDIFVAWLQGKLMLGSPKNKYGIPNERFCESLDGLQKMMKAFGRALETGVENEQEMGEDEDKERGEKNERGRGPAVVIMRGLPGSGKSTLVEQLIAAWKTNAFVDEERAGEPRVASADSYFEGGANLEKQAIKQACAKDPDLSLYRLTFDRALLGDAHAHCRRQFEAALDDLECPLVIVDNTNSTMWEMGFYKRKAALRGCSVDVVEIAHVAFGSIDKFHMRCTHGVPMHVFNDMLGRWEIDPQALYFKPYAVQDV